MQQLKNFNSAVNAVAWSLLCFFAYKMSSNMDLLTASVQELNLKIAVVITDVKHHDEQIKQQRDQIREIENKIGRLRN